MGKTWDRTSNFSGPFLGDIAMFRYCLWHIFGIFVTVSLIVLTCWLGRWYPDWQTIHSTGPPMIPCLEIEPIFIYFHGKTDHKPWDLDGKMGAFSHIFPWTNPGRIDVQFHEVFHEKSICTESVPSPLSPQVQSWTQPWCGATAMVDANGVGRFLKFLAVLELKKTGWWWLEPWNFMMVNNG